MKIVLISSQSHLVELLSGFLKKNGHDAPTIGNPNDASSWPTSVLEDQDCRLVIDAATFKQIPSAAMRYCLVLLQPEELEEFGNLMNPQFHDFLVVPFESQEFEIRLSRMLRLGETAKALHYPNPFQIAKLSAAGEIFAGISHDINNPLMIVSGTLHQIQRVAQIDPPDPTKMTSLLDRGNRATNRITHLVKGLSLLSRISSEEKSKEIPIEKLIQEIQPFCQERFEKAGIQFDIETKNENSLLLCKPTLTSQALICLLHSARSQFSDQSTDRTIHLKTSLNPTTELYEFEIESSSKQAEAPTNNRKFLQSFVFAREVVQQQMGSMDFKHSDNGSHICVRFPVVSPQPGA